MKSFLLSIIVSTFFLLNTNLLADDSELKLSWPIEVESDGGFVTTLYQPQLESFEANVLEGRMAVTINL
jgi:hypothetical protein